MYVKTCCCASCFRELRDAAAALYAFQLNSFVVYNMWYYLWLPLLATSGCGHGQVLRGFENFKNL
jgi:hypothetical protein